jgi:hypothetical protein
MSRITISTYPDGTAHMVVGWDHPAQGAFWQEWATAAEVKDAEEKLEQADVSFPDYQTEVIAETGIKREGGMWPGLSLPLRPHVPDELKVLITDEVERLLLTHAEDAESGRINVALNTLKEN